MKRHLTIENWVGDPRRHALVDDLGDMVEQGAPTPVDASAVRWVLAGTIGFWLLVTLAIHQIF